MEHLTPSDNLKLDSLNELCDTCKKAYDAQDDMALKSLMKDVCKSCSTVRDQLPELMALRRKSHAFNEKLMEKQH